MTHEFKGIEFDTKTEMETFRDGWYACYPIAYKDGLNECFDIVEKLIKDIVPADVLRVIKENIENNGETEGE